LDVPFSELAFARKVTEWLLDEAGNEEASDSLVIVTSTCIHRASNSPTN